MPDVREEYRPLNDQETADMAEIKQLGKAFIEKMEQLQRSTTPGNPKGRNYALAITNAEQAVMWGVKGVTGQ